MGGAPLLVAQPRAESRPASAAKPGLASKKFDGPGKVIAFVGTARATEGSDFVRAEASANEKKRDANDDGAPASPPNANDNGTGSDANVNGE